VANTVADTIEIDATTVDATLHVHGRNVASHDGACFGEGRIAPNLARLRSADADNDSLRSMRMLFRQPRTHRPSHSCRSLDVELGQGGARKFIAFRFAQRPSYHDRVMSRRFVDRESDSRPERKF
jgi:hypothetical protein